MTEKYFDYVIVGGGSAGSVIAKRLADADIGTVALIEAGPADENVTAMMDISKLFELDARTDWGFLATPTLGTDRKLTYSRARMLGGCGNHNDCAFLIPPKSDFDSWRDQGATGWSGEEVAPYFERLKNQLSVELRPENHPVSKAFLSAGAEIGLPRVDFSKEVSAGIGMLTLNAKGKLRSSSSVAYLHPLSNLPKNLTILTETLVEKLLFEGTTVVGCSTNVGHIYAQRELILCAGSIQSPQLLLVSGVGDRDDLAALGIRVVHHSPAVGKNLVDHYSVPVIFETAEEVQEWDITPYEAVAMIGDVDSADPLHSQVQLGLTAGWVNGRFSDGYEASAPKARTIIALEPNVARSKSRGSIFIESSDIKDPPRIELNYLSDSEGYDEKVLIESVRLCRKFGETLAFSKIVKRELLPGNKVITEEQLRDYIYENCQTYYHASGTCKIGAKDDPTAPLTPDLKVKGISNLRVCDASIFPAMVSVNINSTVMMAGEKASELIINDALNRLKQQ